MTTTRHDVLTIDAASIEYPGTLAVSLPCDIAAEACKCLTDGSETAIEYRVDVEPNGQSTHYVYFPNAGRGGVCDGADSQWTDCSSMDDLIDRYANFEDRWSN